MKQYSLILLFILFSIEMSYSQQISNSKNATPAKTIVMEEAPKENENTINQVSNNKNEIHAVEHKKTEEELPSNQTPKAISSTRKQ